MHKPKFLVFGGSGQVGTELCRKLSRVGNVIAFGREVDFAKPGLICGAMREVSYDVVINAAAYTAVDKAESEPDLAMAINGIAPGVIAEEAKRERKIVVHFSTDYVFDGLKSSPYTESDPPHPLNVYGRTKLAGDRAIEAVGGSFLIFRTSWVYGSNGHNFLRTVLRLASERQKLRIVDDQIGTPTSAVCIAECVATVLLRSIGQTNEGLPFAGSGLYNLTNAGQTSWYGFAKEILKQTACEGTCLPEVVPVHSCEYLTAAKRPRNSKLSTQKLADSFGVCLPPWEEAVSPVTNEVLQSPYVNL